MNAWERASKGKAGKEEDALGLLLGFADQPGSGGSSLCPSEDMLAGYASGSLLEKERRDVEEHVAECMACLEAVRLASEWIDADEPSARAPAAAHAPDHRRFAGLGTRRLFRPSPFRRAAVIAAAAAAVLLIALFFPALDDSPTLQGLFERLDQCASPAAVAQLCESGLLDETLLDATLRSGILDGLEAAARRFHEAAALRSPAVEDKTVITLAPLLACRETEPSFQWSDPGEGRIVTVEFRWRDRILWTARSDSTGLPFPADAQKLERGATYHFFLHTADRDGTPLESSGPFIFSVLPDRTAAELDESLQRLDSMQADDPARELFRALLLAGAGVDGEALVCLKPLAERGEGGAAVQMLLAAIHATAGDRKTYRQIRQKLEKLDPADAY